MNIIEAKIEPKRILTLINKNLKYSNFIRKFISSKKSNNWYNLIGSNRISSIPQGLILIITGRMLKLKKASRTKINRLILGNIQSINKDIYHKTIVEKNGSIG